MWGADTPLVIDALIIAGLAATGAAGLVMIGLKLKRKKPPQEPVSKAGNLEDRVQVLERIATDRSHDLAEEIEQLRDNANVRGNA
ncbi:hypothetical protein [uncultured Erythrobacter sp.]|uniref:hypothetical protein n=1 Tax=uncultured Erythrobacter sp. TaxID=263913 RepID=UPI00260C346A|nr:hypothetical protein [uncultured Erythrobacter sp.]